MENLTQGLKVICEKPSAKCMKAIRDKTNLPFSEIKDMIANYYYSSQNSVMQFCEDRIHSILNR